MVDGLRVVNRRIELRTKENLQCILLIKVAPDCLPMQKMPAAEP